MTNNLPTIDIKGKSYVLVKDRILAFNEQYPNGSIQTELISPLDSNIMVIKAIITPDIKTPTRIFTDYSQAKIGQGMINTTSALENCSTSAVGRALAYMGIGVIEGVASADEVIKAEQEEKNSTQLDQENLGLGNCKKCGAKNLMSKSGNLYCADKCWLKSQEDFNAI